MEMMMLEGTWSSFRAQNSISGAMAWMGKNRLAGLAAKPCRALV
jgi:hypothetical protein